MINGTPLLEHRSQYLAWGGAYSMPSTSDWKRDSRLGRSTVLDDYGATDPAEFFAVATECFFEKPRVLRKRHPALYEELKTFYRQDPARELPARPSPTTGELIEPVVQNKYLQRRERVPDRMQQHG